MKQNTEAFYYDKGVGDRKIPGLYDIVGFGLNLRMSEIAATLGIVQLTKISDFLKTRKNNFEVLAKTIGQSAYGALLPGNRTAAESAYYCAAFVLKPEFSGKRNALALEMNKRGIGTSIYYPVALPLSTFYGANKELSRTITYKNAATLANSNIALGIGPHVGNEEMSFVGEILISVLEEVL